MLYTTIGQIKRVSRIGLGTFNTVSDQQAMDRVTGAAIDEGITLFDTAESYRSGGSEKMLGKALLRRRNNVVLATKWGGGAAKNGGRRDYIIAACEASLKRLRTDRIDLYQYHHFDREAPIEETLEALAQLKKAGKIVEYGLSNMPARLVTKVARLAKKMKLATPASCQDQYSYLHRLPEEQLLPTLIEQKMKLLAYYPLAAGILTGKYRQSEAPVAGSRLGRDPEAPAVKKRWADTDWASVEELREISEITDVPMAQLAIGWLLNKRGVGSVITGATSEEQVRQNAQTIEALGKISEWAPPPEPEPAPPAPPPVIVSSEVKELRQHIEGKINEAKLEIFPFPHTLIDNFFPEEIYRKILNYNLFKSNDGSAWNSGSGRKQMLNPTPYQLRSQINFHKKKPEFEADGEVTAFWDTIKSTFLDDDWFPRLIYNKFPQYFALRFGENVERDDFWTQCRRALFVQRHRPGFDLGPHTDVPTRIFTCLFSLPEERGYEHYGTALLRYKDPYMISTGYRHHAFDGFETVKMNEYKPNNFMCFFKTPHSFHAVPPIVEELPNQRYGMQFQFHEPLGGLLEEIEPAPAPKRPKATDANVPAKENA